MFCVCLPGSLRHNREPQVLERFRPADRCTAVHQRGTLPRPAALRMDQPRSRHRRGDIPTIPGAGARVGASGRCGSVQPGHPAGHPDPQQGSHCWEGWVLQQCGEGTGSRCVFLGQVLTGGRNDSDQTHYCIMLENLKHCSHFKLTEILLTISSSPRWHHQMSWFFSEQQSKTPKFKI